MATTQGLCQICNNQLEPTDSGLACSCNRDSATGGNSDENGSIIQAHTLTVYVNPLARDGIHSLRVAGQEDSAAGSATDPVAESFHDRLFDVDEPTGRPMGLMLFNGTLHAARLDRINTDNPPNQIAYSDLQVIPFAAPLSRTEINAIPTVSVTSEDVDNQSSCVICCDLFVLGTIITKLTCNHMFHTSCVTNWLQESGTCPICRRLFSQPFVVRSRNMPPRRNN